MYKNKKMEQKCSIFFMQFNAAKIVIIFQRPSDKLLFALLNICDIIWKNTNFRRRI